LFLILCFSFFYQCVVLLVCSGYSVFCSCSGVWTSISTALVSPVVPDHCFGMVVDGLWIRLGLCVTDLLIFRQPQLPMVVSLVYDEDCLLSGLPETYGILLFSFKQFCTRYSYVFVSLNLLRPALMSCQILCPSMSTVSGHEDPSLWPENSPLNSHCWNTICIHQSHPSILWEMLLLYWNYPLGWKRLQRARFFTVWHHEVFWVPATSSAIIRPYR